jgi:hypothetical protein
MHRKGKYLKNNISLSEVKVEEENDYAGKIFLARNLSVWKIIQLTK